MQRHCATVVGCLSVRGSERGDPLWGKLNDAVSQVKPRKEKFWAGVRDDFSLWGVKPNSLAVDTTC